MEIITKCHGIRKYEEKDIIHFEKGIPGFEILKRYILFPLYENELFSVLHSIEDDSVGLIVISPFSIKNDYEVELDDKLAEKLNLKNPEQALIYNTVTINSKVENTTVNLKAPIIINIVDKLGEQIILDRDDYKVKTPITGV